MFVRAINQTCSAAPYSALYLDSGIHVAGVAQIFESEGKTGSHESLIAFRSQVLDLGAFVHEQDQSASHHETHR
jgi:hypothetical protein